MNSIIAAKADLASSGMGGSLFHGQMSTLGRGCLEEGELQEFFAGRLSGAEHEALEHHLDACPRCLELVACVAAGIAESTPGVGASVSAPDADSLAAAATLDTPLWSELGCDELALLPQGELLGGRYEVRRIIGVGGMGLVYSCLDRSLGREVALKVLRYRPSTRDEAVRAEERLLREAQLLAGLSHPNIVVVFDVGSDDGLVFIAMELVRGRTLGAWLEASPPPSQEAILEVFLAVGRGLAAAHAAGVIHRDLKPANVLVGDDGCVRVTDFGLALSDGRTLAAALAGSEQRDEYDRRSGPLREASGGNRGGLVWVGTPRYMSPEQLSGAPASALSDQFGFTLALAEGLLGNDPFPAETLAQRRSAMAEGPVLSGPSRTLSRALRRLLQRGLAERPSDRYPSLEALCAALDRIRRGRPWRLWSAVGLSLVTFVVIVGLRVTSPATTCEDAQKLVSGIWSPEVRDRISAVVDADDADVWRRLEARFNRFTTHWTRVYSDVCAAAIDEHGAQRERALEQMACLERALAYLHGSAALAENGDAGILQALEAQDTLTSLLDHCERGKTRLVAPLPEHPATQARVFALRLRLAGVWPLQVAGDMEGAERLVEAIEEEAKVVHFTPLLAEVLHRRGTVERHRGDLEQASATLERAVALAEESAYDTLIPELWLALALVDTSRGRLDEAGRSLERVDAYRERGSLPMNIRVLSMRAHLLRTLGRHHAALEVAREMRGVAVGDVEMARALVAESISRTALGEWERALLLQRQALALRVQALGEGHSRSAGAHNLLGETLFALGEMQEAEKHLLSALEIRERLGEGADLERSRVLLNVGRLAQARQDPERALGAVVEALEIREARLGGEHPEVAEALMFVGEVHCAQGDVTAAMPLLRRAHRLLDRLYGPEHPQTALALIAHGEASLSADGEADVPDLTELGRALGVLESAEIRPEERARARAVVERARAAVTPAPSGIPARIGGERSSQAANL